MAHRVGLGIVTTGRELRVRSWNAWLAEATGVAEAAAAGRSLLDFVPPDRATLYRDLLMEVLDAGATRVLAAAFHKYLILCPPGVPSPHFAHMQQHVTIAPLKSEDRVLGLMITIEDVTERLDGERALAARLQRPDPAEHSTALAAVASDDWKLRAAAVRALKQSVSSEEIGHLLQSLQRDHQNLSVLSSAIQVLVSAERDVAPALVRLLRDPSPNLRMHAALALGELRSPEGAQPLIDALEDEDQNVRFHAIEALGRMGAIEAVEALAQLAASADFFLSFAAIDALARIEDALVAPSLIGLLDNQLLRPAVVDALAATGDEDCVVPLAELLNEGAPEAGPVASALSGLRERYEESLGAGGHIVDLARGAISAAGVDRLAAAIEQREAPLGALIAVLSWMGPRALPALLTALGEPGVEATLGDAVEQIGAAAVEPLLERLHAGTREARLGAATLLGRLADRRAVPALVRLLDSADADLCAAAAGALAHLGDASALEPLLRLFAHEHPAVRLAAIAAVNSIGADGTASGVTALLDHQDPHVRECAVRVAGYFGFRDSVPGVMRALDDDVEAVRRAAIEQLPVSEHASAPARLLAALRQETPRNRAAAAHALRFVDGEAMARPLLEALSDPDPWVRYFVLGTLGIRGDGAAAAAVARRAEASDEATHVRIAAIQALARLDADAATGIAARLLDESSEDLACGAVAALDVVGGQAADDLLAHAADSAHSAVRVAAVQALTARTSARAADILAWNARMSEPASLPELAVDGLRRIASSGDAAGRRTAVAALLDLGGQAARREQILAAFGRVPASAVEAIADGLRSEKISVRLMAVDALARIRQPIASEALAVALEDGAPEVRAAAVVAFGRLGSPAAASVIAAMRTSDPDAGVRRRAEAACRRHGWGAAR